MFETVRDKVFPFIKSMGRTGDPDERSTYSHHMQDALFMMPTARVLANVVDQLDDIDMADRDTKGRSVRIHARQDRHRRRRTGKFRTPRHIIKLMVDMTAPTPNDVICDPACGTAGFLVAASEHLVEHHGDRIYKDAQARRRFNEGTFHGYDFDTTMLRIGSMNMLLHGVENLDICYKDSLAQGGRFSGRGLPRRATCTHIAIRIPPNLVSATPNRHNDSTKLFPALPNQHAP